MGMRCAIFTLQENLDAIYHSPFPEATTMLVNQKNTRRINLGITKCYLLECSGGYLLIDTGYPDDFGKFIGALHAMQIPVTAIRYLLLTHHHDDHAGFAAQLVAQSGCRVIVHQAALPYLRQGEPENTSKPVNWQIRLVFSFFSLFHRSFGFPPFAPTEQDIIIAGDDAQVLKSIGVDGKILHTPGHTDDSISVILSDGRAFVGDVAMNFLNFCQIKYRPIYLQDKEAVFASWRKLIAQGAGHIYPGHGDDFPAQKLVFYGDKGR
jgi:glyoxylase-like metal-dependent hydrolase (beta-lactamase superfamily II)